MTEETENSLIQIQKAVVIMFKKILICSICLMILFCVGVSAARQMPQGTPPEGFEMPQGTPPEGFEMPPGTPPEGMELPEGVEPPQDIPEDMQDFSGGGQGKRPQLNINNTQTENEQPTESTKENKQKLQEQNYTQQQEQNAETTELPNMDFYGGGMPAGFGGNNMQSKTETMTFAGFVKEYQTPVISVVLLLLAFVFVKLYKRKNY